MLAIDANGSSRLDSAALNADGDVAVACAVGGASVKCEDPVGPTRRDVEVIEVDVDISRGTGVLYAGDCLSGRGRASSAHVGRLGLRFTRAQAERGDESQEDG